MSERLCVYCGKILNKDTESNWIDNACIECAISFADVSYGVENDE